MVSGKIIRILGLTIIGISLFSCKTEEIILHGNLSGRVTDATSSLPIEAASVKLIESGDSIETGSDGTFHFKSLSPGIYNVETSKLNYGTSNNDITVNTAETGQIDIPLIRLPNISVTFLDFGLDSTTLRFTISPADNKKVSYVLSASQDWININPSAGVLNNETDSITVTINKTGLSPDIYKETIIASIFGTQSKIGEIPINILLNGVMDRDENYYKVVKIGGQIWMAENLNVGTRINGSLNQSDNGIIEKYCYADRNDHCDLYGGLYQWAETMQYNPTDNKPIGTTQGICPAGWHIPTRLEWDELCNELGGHSVAGGKLKEAGTVHWSYPNVGATNETGFTALPGGTRFTDGKFITIGWNGWWQTSTESSLYWDESMGYVMHSDATSVQRGGDSPTNHNYKKEGGSLRCVKDPGKK